MATRNRLLLKVLIPAILALAMALAVAWLLGNPAQAQGATLTGTSTADAHDNNLADGVCNDGTGRCTLRAAIEQAASGDTVVVANGVYTLISATLTINETLALQGQGPGTL